MSGLDAENVADYMQTIGPSQLLVGFHNGKRSPQIGQLVAALASAQLQFEPLHKDTENPFFKSKYADLSQVIAATRKALADNGLVVIQTPIAKERLAGVVSILAHKSGEWIEDELLLPAGVSKFDAQTIGSAVTYARRYSYQALIGIAAEVDDDANGASGNNGSKEAQQAVVDRKLGVTGHRTNAAAFAKSSPSKVSLLIGEKEAKVFGQGLAQLVQLLDQHKPELKKEPHMRWDGIAWYVRNIDALALQQFCEAHQMVCECIEKTTGEVKSSGASVHGLEPKMNRATPGPEVGTRGPSTPKRAILAGCRLMGPLDDVNAKNGKKGGFLILQVGEYKAYIFDNKRMDFGKPKGVIPIFEELQKSKHQVVELLIEKSEKDGKEFLAVKNVLRLACFEWEPDGMPVVRRDLSEPPDITDEELGV